MHHQMSFTQWLRQHHANTHKNCGQHLPVSVGIKFLSLFNEIFFFQYLSMNHPHERLNDILPDHGNIPRQLRHFKTASLLTPGLPERETFQSIINTALAYIGSLKDMLVAYQNNYLTHSESQVTLPCKFQLSGKQLSLLATFEEFIAARNTEYREHEYDIVNWKKMIMVKGHAGTGKSYFMEACISHCLQKKFIVHIATPTGTLASIYKGMYSDTLTLILSHIHVSALTCL